MSRGVITGLVGAGTLVAGLLMLYLGYLGFQNTAHGFEVDVKAQYVDNQNVYDNGWKEVQEKAQIPDIFTEDLKEVYREAMTGRYGTDGSNPLLQFIREENPTLDPEIYRQVQQSVEIFRNQFQQGQTQLIARKQEYERFLTATYSGRFFNQFGGYPRIDMNTYATLSSERTDSAFETKQEEPLDINN